MAVPISNVTATWANSAIVFTGIGFNANASAYLTSSKLLDLKLNSSSLFAVDSQGNVGIGTTSGSYKLDVNGSARVRETLTVSTNNTTGGGIIFADDGDIVDLNDGYCSMRFSLGVRVHSGNKTGSAVVTLTNGGEVRATNEVTAYYSDKRLKANIVPISSATEKLKAISGIYYENNDLAKSYGFTKTERQVGVIAQDVQSVLPEVIRKAPFDIDEQSKSKSGENYLTVKYELLVPLLIEALKEALERIEKLENK